MSEFLSGLQHYITVIKSLHALEVNVAEPVTPPAGSTISTVPSNVIVNIR